MGHIVAVTDTTSAKNTDSLMRQHLLRLHGCPLELVNDRDSQATFSLSFIHW